MKEDAARPGTTHGEQTWGKLRDVKRPACFSVADRRVSKLRHDCLTATSQACSVGRGERRTPTDRVRTRRRRRSVQSPTAEAIKLQPSDWCPLVSNGRSDQTPTARLVSNGRSDQTPTVRLVSSGRSDQTPTVRLVSSGRSDQPQPPDWCPAAEGLITPTAERARWEKGLSLQPTERGRGRRAYHSVDSANAACEGLYHSASAASLLGDLFGAARALGKCPQVSRAGNAGKA